MLVHNYCLLKLIPSCTILIQMISVIVLTKDEQERIKACLESVSWADEIIVYDSNSKDKTLDIARKYTDKIYKYFGEDFSEVRNLAMEKVRGDWVLYIDADERVLQPLRNEFLELIKQDKFSAIAISRRNIIFGNEVNYGFYKNDWMVRLFKRGKFKKWVGKIHEYATFDGQLGYAKNKLLHLTHRDVDQIVLKSLYWSNFDAKLRFEAKHPKMTGWRFLRILITESFNQGIKRGGFFGGTVGVMDSLLQVFSLLISYIRLWQLQQAKDVQTTYDEIDAKLLDSNFKF